MFWEIALKNNIIIVLRIKSLFERCFPSVLPLCFYLFIYFLLLLLFFLCNQNNWSPPMDLAPPWPNLTANDIAMHCCPQQSMQIDQKLNKKPQPTTWGKPTIPTPTHNTTHNKNTTPTTTHNHSKPTKNHKPNQPTNQKWDEIRSTRLQAQHDHREAHLASHREAPSVRRERDAWEVRERGRVRERRRRGERKGKGREWRLQTDEREKKYIFNFNE